MYIDEHVDNLQIIWPIIFIAFITYPFSNTNFLLLDIYVVLYNLDVIYGIHKIKLFASRLNQ